MRLKLLLLLILPLIYSQAQLFDYGEPFGDQVLSYSADQHALALDIPVVFLERSSSELYIASNGIVGIGNKLPEVVTPLQHLNRSAIAVYYAPIIESTVYYRSTSSDQTELRRLSDFIHKLFADSSEFNALQAVVITWDGVQNKEMDGIATFQLALASDGLSTYSILQYRTLPWSASEGFYAQTGFADRDGVHLTNANSGRPDVKEIISLSNNNEGNSFVFRVSGSAFEDPRENGEEYDYANYDQDYDGEERRQPPSDCPPDPYRERCPDGCNVLTDDRGCSLCVCAERADSTEDNTLDEMVERVPEPNRENEEVRRREQMEIERVSSQRREEEERRRMEMERVSSQRREEEERRRMEMESVSAQNREEEDRRRAQQEMETVLSQRREEEDSMVEENTEEIIVDSEDSTPQSCSMAGEAACHKDAQCRDHSPGYCCECGTGFYGNGKECLKKGDPQRMSGFFEGVINGKAIDRTDLHTFITATDGNAYTAVSKIPSDLGYPFLLLNPIGSVMGWLFAEVRSPSAYNGFQQTGGLFNRTVTLHIGDRYYVTIRQQFAGRDIYHYLKANVFVSGTLPDIAPDSEIIFPDYEEEYRREGSGFIRSYTGMDILLRENGVERTMRMTVDQQIQYIECPFKPFDKEDTITLHVKRVHVTYDQNEGIVRYASRNYADLPSAVAQPAQPPRDSAHFDRKQHGQTQQQAAQPVRITDGVCATGSHVCTLPHMRCRPWEQSYRCECVEGFQAKHDTSSSIGWNCQDVDECERGHTCGQQATCTNTEGAFTCQCNPGYTGDGHTCISMDSPSPQQSIPMEDARSEQPAEQKPKGTCSNHRQCHQYGECSFTPGVPTGVCKCRGWYVGDGVDHCGPPQEEARPQHNANIAERGGKPCGTSVCARDAECMPHPSGGSECVCRAGFVGNGINCESLLDEEEEQQTAVVEGTVGKVCRSHDECSEHGSCAYHHQLGYYQCACTEPYQGNGVECSKPGEIQLEPADSTGCDVTRDCHEFADCVFERTVLGGNYRCVCQSGYSGDGKYCAKTQLGAALPPLEQPGCDRLRNCDQNAQCVYDSHNRKYRCECHEGFAGDGTTCVRIHSGSQNWEGERVAQQRCREQTDCHQNGHCVVAGSGNEYVCECLPGFRGDGVSSCTAADQCNPSDPSACHQNSECVFGSVESAYVCKCVTGFTGDGSRCVPYAAATSCNENPRLCHANAQCVFNHEQNTHVCLCKPGSVGDGYSRCDVQDTPRCSDCSVHAHCAQSPSTAGWQCKCNAGYNGNGHVCAAMTSCLDDRSLCDVHAECVPGEGGQYVCNCHYGYHGNGRTCSPDSESRSDSLFVARGMAIFQRGTKADVPGKQLIVIPHHIAVGLDFDCEEERLVWSDISGHSIRSASINGTDHKSFFAEDLNSPEGIAVDWASRNVYYADSLNDEIGVASLDGKYKKSLVTEGLVNPRSVVIDLYNRHLYYTDWHRENPFIGRVDTDGKNNKIFLNTDIHLPNGLTILPNRRELCWVDAGNHRLSCIDFNGENRRVVYAPLEYPFGLTHDNEERFYWTDWKDNRIHTVGVYGEAYASFPISIGGSGKVYGIISVPKKCSGPPSPCAVNNGGCKYLCLPGSEGVHCECPDNLAVKGC